jgi:hypothetical protein
MPQAVSIDNWTKVGAVYGRGGQRLVEEGRRPEIRLRPSSLTLAVA